MDVSLMLGYVKSFMSEFGILDIFTAALGTVLIIGVVFYVIKTFARG